MTTSENRRDVAARKVTLFHRLARVLVSWGLHPNHISVMSSFFALLAGGALALAGGSRSIAQNLFLLFVALVGIQLRLICNLIDGLMAVEGGLKTVTGELYNDIPDRFSDIFILVGAGYSASFTCPHALELSWLAAVFAVLTAYVRVLGSSMGAPHFFTGPMAKQHRMFVMNCAIIASAIEFSFFQHWGYSLCAALLLIFVGSAATCVVRLKKISRALNSKT